MNLTALSPSGLRNVFGVADPSAAMESNWALIVAHWPGITLPFSSTADMDEDEAKDAVEANFSAIEAEVGALGFKPVAGGYRGGVYLQYNLELLNAAW